jgi:hypothetical protein
VFLDSPSSIFLFPWNVDMGWTSLWTTRGTSDVMMVGTARTVRIALTPTCPRTTLAKEGEKKKRSKVKVEIISIIPLRDLSERCHVDTSGEYRIYRKGILIPSY